MIRYSAFIAEPLEVVTSINQPSALKSHYFVIMIFIWVLIWPALNRHLPSKIIFSLSTDRLLLTGLAGFIPDFFSLSHFVLHWGLSFFQGHSELPTRTGRKQWENWQTQTIRWVNKTRNDTGGCTHKLLCCRGKIWISKRFRRFPVVATDPLRTLTCLRLS